MNERIPKLKKIAKTSNLQNVDINNRDVQHLLRDVNKACLDIDFCQKWKAVKVAMVHNAELEASYVKKRCELKEIRSSQSVKESFGFLEVDSSYKEKIVREGLRVHRQSFNKLGKGDSGVCLNRFFDIELRSSVQQCKPGTEKSIFVFKYVPGKCKSIALKDIYNGGCFEPTPNYDCHVSSLQPNTSDPLFTQKVRSCIYFYEYTEDCEPSPCPRQCLPYAVITCRLLEDPGKPPVTSFSAKKERGKRHKNDPKASNPKQKIALRGGAAARESPTRVNDVSISSNGALSDSLSTGFNFKSGCDQNQRHKKEKMTPGVNQNLGDLIAKQEDYLQRFANAQRAIAKEKDDRYSDLRDMLPSQASSTPFQPEDFLRKQTSSHHLYNGPVGRLQQLMIKGAQNAPSLLQGECKMDSRPQQFASICDPRFSKPNQSVTTQRPEKQQPHQFESDLASAFLDHEAMRRRKKSKAPTCKRNPNKPLPLPVCSSDGKFSTVFRGLVNGTYKDIEIPKESSNSHPAKEEAKLANVKELAPHNSPCENKGDGSFSKKASSTQIKGPDGSYKDANVPDKSSNSHQAKEEKKSVEGKVLSSRKHYCENEGEGNADEKADGIRSRKETEGKVDRNVKCSTDTQEKRNKSVSIDSDSTKVSTTGRLEKQQSTLESKKDIKAATIKEKMDRSIFEILGASGHDSNTSKHSTLTGLGIKADDLMKGKMMDDSTSHQREASLSDRNSLKPSISTPPEIERYAMIKEKTDERGVKGKDVSVSYEKSTQSSTTTHVEIEKNTMINENMGNKSIAQKVLVSDENNLQNSALTQLDIETNSVMKENTDGSRSELKELLVSNDNYLQLKPLKSIPMGIQKDLMKEKSDKSSNELKKTLVSDVSALEHSTSAVPVQEGRAVIKEKADGSSSKQRGASHHDVNLDQPSTSTQSKAERVAANEKAGGNNGEWKAVPLTDLDLLKPSMSSHQEMEENTVIKERTSEICSERKAVDENLLKSSTSIQQSVEKNADKSDGKWRVERNNILVSGVSSLNLSMHTQPGNERGAVIKGKAGESKWKEASELNNSSSQLPLSTLPDAMAIQNTNTSTSEQNKAPKSNNVHLSKPSTLNERQAVIREREAERTREQIEVSAAQIPSLKSFILTLTENETVSDRTEKADGNTNDWQKVSELKGPSILSTTTQPVTDGDVMIKEKTDGSLSEGKETFSPCMHPFEPSTSNQSRKESDGQNSLLISRDKNESAAHEYQHQSMALDSQTDSVARQTLSSPMLADGFDTMAGENHVQSNLDSENSGDDGEHRFTRAISMQDVGIHCYLNALCDSNYQPDVYLLDCCQMETSCVQHKDCKTCERDGSAEVLNAMTKITQEADSDSNCGDDDDDDNDDESHTALQTDLSAGDHGVPTSPHALQINLPPVVSAHETSRTERQTHSVTESSLSRVKRYRTVPPSSRKIVYKGVKVMKDRYCNVDGKSAVSVSVSNSSFAERDDIERHEIAFIEKENLPVTPVCESNDVYPKHAKLTLSSKNSLSKSGNSIYNFQPSGIDRSSEVKTNSTSTINEFEIEKEKAEGSYSEPFRTYYSEDARNACKNISGENLESREEKRKDKDAIGNDKYDAFVKNRGEKSSSLNLIYRRNLFTSMENDQFENNPQNTCFKNDEKRFSNDAVNDLNSEGRVNSVSQICVSHNNEKQNSLTNTEEQYSYFGMSNMGSKNSGPEDLLSENFVKNTEEKEENGGKDRNKTYIGDTRNLFENIKSITESGNKHNKKIKSCVSEHALKQKDSTLDEHRNEKNGIDGHDVEKKFKSSFKSSAESFQKRRDITNHRTDLEEENASHNPEISDPDSKHPPQTVDFFNSHHQIREEAEGTTFDKNSALTIKSKDINSIDSISSAVSSSHITQSSEITHNTNSVPNANSVHHNIYSAQTLYPSLTQELSFGDVDYRVQGFDNASPIFPNDTTSVICTSVLSNQVDQNTCSFGKICEYGDVDYRYSSTSGPQSVGMFSNIHSALTAPQFVTAIMSKDTSAAFTMSPSLAGCADEHYAQSKTLTKPFPSQTSPASFTEKQKINNSQNAAVNIQSLEKDPEPHPHHYEDRSAVNPDSTSPWTLPMSSKTSAIPGLDVESGSSSGYLEPEVVKATEYEHTHSPTMNDETDGNIETQQDLPKDLPDSRQRDLLESLQQETSTVCVNSNERKCRSIISQVTSDSGNTALTSLCQAYGGLNEENSVDMEYPHSSTSSCHLLENASEIDDTNVQSAETNDDDELAERKEHFFNLCRKVLETVKRQERENKLNSLRYGKWSDNNVETDSPQSERKSSDDELGESFSYSLQSEKERMNKSLPTASPKTSSVGMESVSYSLSNKNVQSIKTKSDNTTGLIGCDIGSSKEGDKDACIKTHSLTQKSEKCRTLTVMRRSLSGSSSQKMNVNVSCDEDEHQKPCDRGLSMLSTTTQPSCFLDANYSVNGKSTNSTPGLKVRESQEENMSVTTKSKETTINDGQLSPSESMENFRKLPCNPQFVFIKSAERVDPTCRFKETPLGRKSPRDAALAVEYTGPIAEYFTSDHIPNKFEIEKEKPDLPMNNTLSPENDDPQCKTTSSSDEPENKTCGAKESKKPEQLIRSVSAIEGSVDDELEEGEIEETEIVPASKVLLKRTMSSPSERPSSKRRYLSPPKYPFLRVKKGETISKNTCKSEDLSSHVDGGSQIHLSAAIGKPEKGEDSGKASSQESHTILVPDETKSLKHEGKPQLPSASIREICRNAPCTKSMVGAAKECEVYVSDQTSVDPPATQSDDSPLPLQVNPINTQETRAVNEMPIDTAPKEKENLFLSDVPMEALSIARHYLLDQLSSLDEPDEEQRPPSVMSKDTEVTESIHELAEDGLITKLTVDGHIKELGEDNLGTEPAGDYLETELVGDGLIKESTKEPVISEITVSSEDESSLTRTVHTGGHQMVSKFPVVRNKLRDNIIITFNSQSDNESTPKFQGKLKDKNVQNRMFEDVIVVSDTEDPCTVNSNQRKVKLESSSEELLSDQTAESNAYEKDCGREYKYIVPKLSATNDTEKIIISSPDGMSPISDCEIQSSSYSLASYHSKRRIVISSEERSLRHFQSLGSPARDDSKNLYSISSSDSHQTYQRRHDSLKGHDTRLSREHSRVNRKRSSCQSPDCHDRKRRYVSDSDTSCDKHQVISSSSLDVNSDSRLRDSSPLCSSSSDQRFGKQSRDLRSHDYTCRDRKKKSSNSSDPNNCGRRSPPPLHGQQRRGQNTIASVHCCVDNQNARSRSPDRPLFQRGGRNSTFQERYRLEKTGKSSPPPYQYRYDRMQKRSLTPDHDNYDRTRRRSKSPDRFGIDRSRRGSPFPSSYNYVRPRRDSSSPSCYSYERTSRDSRSPSRYNYDRTRRGSPSLNLYNYDRTIRGSRSPNHSNYDRTRSPDHNNERTRRRISPFPDRYSFEETHKDHSPSERYHHDRKRRNSSSSDQDYRDRDFKKSPSLDKDFYKKTFKFLQQCRSSGPPKSFPYKNSRWISPSRRKY